MSAHSFEVLAEDRFRLNVPGLGALDLDRIRREKHSLIGELAVSCELPGARTVNGYLSIGELNLSSVRARAERARYLATRSRAAVDWVGLLDELAQRVMLAERHGSPAVDLATLPEPAPDQFHDVGGLVVPREHASIVFGDGGSAKSYLLLYFLGELARQGVRVMLCDWELSQREHRTRLGKLFEELPPILYVHCLRPLVYEADRIRRLVRDHGVEFVGYDSVAFACDGRPEEAESAARYFRALRKIGTGSLHVAHTTKAVEGDQKPFGSVFWSNGAKSTWNAKLLDEVSSSTRQLGLYNRKENLEDKRPATAFEITFSHEATRFRRVNVADIPDLAAALSLSQRLRAYLRSGSKTRAEIADEFSEVKPGTLKRTINRAIQAGQLVRFPGARGDEIGLSR